MTTYTHHEVANPLSATATWILQDYEISSVSGALVVLVSTTNPDDVMRLTGSGFVGTTGPTGTLTAGIIALVSRTDADGLLTYETIGSFGTYLATTFSTLLANADQKAFFADLFPAAGDVLNGHSGNDFLAGGDGGDTLNGGAGFDWADYANATAGLTVNLTTPNVSTGFANGDTFNSIEAIRGSDFNDILVGNASNNFLRGGLGQDLMNGGTGFDFASYRNSTVGITVDLATPANNTGEAIGDTFISIEGLEGSNFSDTLRGDANQNFLRGAAGGDVLDGGGHSDDYADYQGSTVGLTADLQTPGNNTGDALGDTYISIELIRGSAFADTLRGNASDNNLRGGLGGDTLDGRGGFDSASYENSSAGLTVDLLTPGNNTGEAIGDTYTSIESIRGSTFADILRGDNSDNFLRGQEGGDQLDGRDGIDYASYAAADTGIIVDMTTPTTNTGEANGDTFTSIEGISGTSFGDILVGDGGDNFLKGNGGADNLIGNLGTDLADYTSSSIGLTVSLATPGSNTGEAFGDTYNSIEGLIGSDFADNLTGDGGANVLTGRNGSDTLIGGAGSDIMNGGNGDDIYSVDATGDVVNEGSGALVGR